MGEGHFLFVLLAFFRLLLSLLLLLLLQQPDLQNPNTTLVVPKHMVRANLASWHQHALLPSTGGLAKPVNMFQRFGVLPLPFPLSGTARDREINLITIFRPFLAHLLKCLFIWAYICVCMCGILSTSARTGCTRRNRS